MTLAPGTRFGSYEIVEPIGRGGMGEVWRAHDVALERDVAVKVLPASFADDTDRVARFEQEAKTLAALNHPNIAQIYGIERAMVAGRPDGMRPDPGADVSPATAAEGTTAGQDHSATTAAGDRAAAQDDPAAPAAGDTAAGKDDSAATTGPGAAGGAGASAETTALVMELVEGPTLADRIAEGPLPADEALNIAMQIANALEAAHGRGIVHRDLKPANVKLTPEGTVKVLDFGIAKAAASTTATSGGMTPTLLTPALTEAGVLLGTAAYMSPEQARGKPIDQRADIWAFGCLLYEMLTGQLAFAGEDVTTTLARVLEREADTDSLPGTVSPAVRHTIGLCLQKDPRKRIADIRDVRLALEGGFAHAAHEEGVDTTGGAEAAASRSGRMRYASGAFVVGAAASAIAVFALTTSETPPPRITRFTIEMPAGEELGLDSQSQSFAITRDGATIAFATTPAANEYQWYLRPIDSVDPRLLGGARLTFETPFFSPDGRQIGFDDGSMWRMSVLGGTPIRITDPQGRLRGASWSDSGGIVYAVEGSGIWRVAADGGEPEQVTEPETRVAHRWPQWLPGEHAVLFTRSEEGADQVALLDLDSGETRILIPDGTAATYSPTGHIVYGIADGSMRGVRFDIESLSVLGDPVPLIQDVSMPAATRGMHYALSAEGTLIYARGSSGSISGLAPIGPAWLTDTGELENVGMEPCFCNQAAISPDGTRLALAIQPPASAAREADIWIWSFEQRTLTRLTFENLQISPVWSPDSSRIAYRDRSLGLVVRRADGIGAPEVIVASTELRPSLWTADDRLIYAHEGTGGTDISIVSATPDAEPVVLLDDEFDEFAPALSPDGRWLAYVSDETSRVEIYVRPFPDVDGGKWQVSRTGGTDPAWAPDGSRLYFRSSDSLMTAPIEDGATFVAGPPDRLFDLMPILQSGLNFRFAVDPVTGRILLGVPQGEPARDVERTPAQLIVVQNFAEELKRLLPAE